MSREFEIVSNPQFRNLHVFLVHMRSRAPHIHHELEIGYILWGKASLRIGEKSFELTETDGYLINPLEAHEFHTDVDGAVILAIQVSPKLFDSFFSETPLLRFFDSSRLSQAIPGQEDRLCLMGKCLELAACYVQKSPRYEYDCFALIADILARLHRLLPAEEMTQAAWQPIRHRMERLVGILDYIDANYHRKLLLEEIARREGLTMTHLSHIFRDTLGMSFQEYLKKRRFEHARALILGTRRSLLDISLESGFSDTRYMIRMFEEEFGCAPRAYRKANAPIPGILRDTGDTQYFLEQADAMRVLNDVRREWGPGQHRELP